MPKREHQKLFVLTGVLYYAPLVLPLYLLQAKLSAAFGSRA